MLGQLFILISLVMQKGPRDRLPVRKSTFISSVTDNFSPPVNERGRMAVEIFSCQKTAGVAIHLGFAALHVLA